MLLLRNNSSHTHPNQANLVCSLRFPESGQLERTHAPTVTIVVLSRLAYRKGIDLLVATAPRICATFPNVRFVVGKSSHYNQESRDKSPKWQEAMVPS